MLHLIARNVKMNYFKVKNESTYMKNSNITYNICIKTMGISFLKEIKPSQQNFIYICKTLLHTSKTHIQPIYHLNKVKN